MSPQEPTFDVLVTASTFPASSEDTVLRYALEIGKGLQTYGGHRVLALAPHQPGIAERETLEGVEVRRYRYAAPSRLERLSAGSIMAELRRSPALTALVPSFVGAQLGTVLALCRRERPRALIANWIVPQGIVGAVAKRLFPRMRLVVIVLGGDAALIGRNALTRRLGRWVVESADAVVAVSGFLADAVSSATGLSRSRIHVIPTGVDLEKFERLARAAPRRSGSTGLRLGFVGRLEEKKGVDVLLRALPALRAQVPGATLQVYGGGSLREGLEATAASLQLGDAVTFHGPVSHRELPAALSALDALVVPSVNLAGDVEGLPTVILEAGALKVPVIATDAGGNRDFVEDGQTGMLVPQRDPEAIARAALRLHGDEVLRTGVVARAYERLASGFTYRSAAVRLSALVRGESA